MFFFFFVIVPEKPHWGDSIKCCVRIVLLLSPEPCESLRQLNLGMRNCLVSRTNAPLAKRLAAPWG